MERTEIFELRTEEDVAEFCRLLLEGKERAPLSLRYTMMAHYDCCGIRGATCKGGDPNPCCINTIYGKGLCPFWLHDQCQFENCECKLWLCQTAVNTTDPKCIEGLMLLEKFGKLYGILRDPLIRHPYSGAAKR